MIIYIQVALFLVIPKLLGEPNLMKKNAAIEAIGNPDAIDFAKTFAALLQEGAIKEDVNTILYGYERS